MTDKSEVLADLMPKDPIMGGAWAGSMQYALGNPEIMEAFTRETGMKWRPGRTAIDRAIDEATGIEADFFRAFAKWHNENIWGEV